MALAHTLLAPLRSLLRRLVNACVETRLIEPSPEALALDPSLPTLYVLPHPALSDTLLLEALCQRHGLPSAGGKCRTHGIELPACLPLPARRRRLWRRGTASPAPFLSALEQLAANPGATCSWCRSAYSGGGPRANGSASGACWPPIAGS
ncbi:hypothetical protein [Halomonas sp. BC04]|uniref:hypothetical protein n=1 Tax=Halomonas sp. BC04 TaxID=1403540 RepID=UPI0004BA234A|nr:hypothetical protein [Halomonas sp. BC04]